MAGDVGGMIYVSTKGSAILMGLTGDVLIDRDNPHEVFADVRELLHASDILFAFRRPWAATRLPWVAVGYSLADLAWRFVLLFIPIENHLP